MFLKGDFWCESDKACDIAGQEEYRGVYLHVESTIYFIHFGSLNSSELGKTHRTTKIRIKKLISAIK